MRKFPIFTVFGSGDYRIQPVFVEDVAEIAVSVGHRGDNLIMDVVGPEVYTFDELVKLIRGNVNSRAKIIHTRPELAFLLARLIGYAVKDVVITREEIRGLMSNLLVSASQPTAPTRFSEWLSKNADGVGIRYISGLERRYR